MSKSGDLQREVKRIIRTHNVDLKDSIKDNLQRIAGDFHAQELITQATVDKMSVTGVDSFDLATKLLNACQPSLVRSPEKNFPKFIDVLKDYETLKELAETMEEEFDEAMSKLPVTSSSSKAGKPQGRAASQHLAGTSASRSRGSQKILTTRDLQDVKDALRTFKKEKWMDLGGILGVRDEVLEEVRADYTQKGVNQCLGEMLKSWLKKKTYKEARYGSPTWENLANAVEKSDDPALADTIREHHL